MQKEGNTGTLQMHQHTQDTVRQPQEQGPQKQPNRHHLPLQMLPNKLPQCLHRRIRQITGRKSQRTFQGPIPYPPTQHHHRTPNGPRTVQHCQQPVQDHQGSHVHTCSGPNPQQEPMKVPATARMGPPSNGISHPAVQAFQSSNYTHPHLINSLLVSSHPPAAHTGRGTYFHSKYTFGHTSPLTPLNTPQIPNLHPPTAAPSW